jgi:hypothetical protein
MAYIPARFLGPSSVRLRSRTEPYLDGDGNPRSSLVLYPGDTLMMPDVEVLGQTYKRNPINPDADYVWLGPGHVVLPDHEGCTAVELRTLGYEFHLGRPDFEPIIRETIHADTAHTDSE